MFSTVILNLDNFNMCGLELPEFFNSQNSSTPTLGNSGEFNSTYFKVAKIGKHQVNSSALNLNVVDSPLNVKDLIGSKEICNSQLCLNTVDKMNF